MGSGHGSTIQAALDLVPEIDIRVVVSNKPLAFNLIRAKRAAVPQIRLEPIIQWEELQKELKRRSVNALFLLGFMKVVPGSFLQAWQGRVFNIHPSLLPAYRGLKALEKSFEQESDMGVTIHKVTEGLDEGPSIYQTKVILHHEKPSSLSQARMRLAFAEQNLIRRTLLSATRHS
jgi:phosphoribosylglycinamide formyltransferase-1